MKFTEDWFSQHIPTWKQALAHLKGKPIHAIELGVYEGRASVWLLENILTHPKSTLTCVDTWKGGVEHSDKDMAAVEERFYDNVSFCLEELGQDVEKVAIYTGSTTDFLLGNQDQKADLIYIDASHQAADVLTDAVLSHMLLKPGGIIIFDDYGWGGMNHAPNVPRGAIDAFMECYAEQYDQIYIGYQVILKKKDDRQNKTQTK